MKKLIHIDRHSLSAQIVMSFVALVLLTAVAIGIPTILLVRQQVENEAWAQVAQGQSAANAFYSAQQRTITDLALLTSQRPFLTQLLAQGEAQPLWPLICRS